MKKFSRISLIVFAFSLQALLTGCSSDSAIKAATPKDSVALTGVTAGKGLFDINISNTGQESEEQKLMLYLDVIKQTHDGLVFQNVTPDFVIAFRGSSVKFLTNTASAALKAKIAEVDALSNVRFEACSVATGIFGVDNITILPAVVVVGNTFISSIGYQAKGFAPILIQ